MSRPSTARPPAPTRRSQQQRFEAFRLEYNTVRPHEALGDETPASAYTRSPRPYPATLPPVEYPAHYGLRLVSRNGGIRWQKHWVNVSHVLAGEYVGLVKIEDKDLARRIGHYIREYNKHPRPVRWTYDNPKRRIRVA